MRILGWILGIISALSLTILFGFSKKIIIIIPTLYLGIIVYQLFRTRREDRKSALKNTAIISILYLIIGLIHKEIMASLIAKGNALTEGSNIGPESIMSMFTEPSYGFILLIAVCFMIFPTIAMFLEGLTKPDKNGFKRNSFLTFFYMLITLNFYSIYWFWLIKRALNKQNIETRTLWFFLIPIIGAILIYYDFSKALEKHTKRDFIVWFLIFLFLNGLDIPINQHLLNLNIESSNN